MFAKRFIYTVVFIAIAFFLSGAVEVTIPPEQQENSVDADESYYTGDSVIACGQLVDTNDEETFIGPTYNHFFGYFLVVVIGTAATCDILDAETEALVDGVILLKMPPYKISGFFCLINSDPTNDVTFTLRAAEANLTPSISCTIEGTGTSQSCAATVGTATDIPNGTPIAIRANYSEDLDAVDAWCKIYIATKSQ